jgi:pimeloyl-ACP methyl ester carboxylesterase
LEIEGVGRFERFGQRPPVVILSNAQADPGWWTPPFVSALGSAGYEAIPFVPSGTSYAPDDVVRDVAKFIECLDSEPVRLLGWSQGAAIAQEVALRRPTWSFAPRFSPLMADKTASTGSCRERGRHWMPLAQSSIQPNKRCYC